MNARDSADVGSALNAERLRYVTEHFYQLQGLTLVGLGGALLVPEGFLDILPLRGWLRALTVLVLAAAFIATLRYLPKYYRCRFGWIEPRSMTNRQFVFLLLGLLALLFFGRPIGHHADSIIADIQFMIPAHPVTFSPAALWLFLLCVSFRKNLCQEELYRMYFMASGALGWALVALYPIWNPDAMHPALWRLLNAGWLGVSLIALGLYDHLTLVRLMPERIENPEADDRGVNLG